MPNSSHFLTLKRVFGSIFEVLTGMAQILKKRIISFIDFFYPPFSRIMPLQTFRYAACGGSNTLVDIVMYAVGYNLILHKHDVNLGFLVIKPHIASIIIAWCFSFPMGFFL